MADLSEKAIKKKESTVKSEDGVFVYIGPTIRGVIQNGSIYRGTREDIVKSLASVIEKYPKAETLIIKDIDLVEARKKLSCEGNSLSAAYRAVALAE